MPAIMMKHFIFYIKLFLEFYGLKGSETKLKLYTPRNRWLLYKQMGTLYAYQKDF